MRELKSLGPFSFCLLFLCVQKKKHRFLFCSFTQTSTDHSVSLFSSPVFFFLRKERKRKRERNSFFSFIPHSFFFFVYNLRDGAFCHLVTLDPNLLFKLLFLFPIVIFSSLSPFRYFIFVFSYFPFFFFVSSPAFIHICSEFFFFFVLSQSSFFFFGFFGFLFRPLFFFCLFAFIFCCYSRPFLFYCSLQWTASLVQHFLLLLFVTVWYYPPFLSAPFSTFLNRNSSGERRKKRVEEIGVLPLQGVWATQDQLWNTYIVFFLFCVFTHHCSPRQEEKKRKRNSVVFRNIKNKTKTPAERKQQPLRKRRRLLLVLFFGILSVIEDTTSFIVLSSFFFFGVFFLSVCVLASCVFFFFCTLSFYSLFFFLQVSSLQSIRKNKQTNKISQGSRFFFPVPQNSIFSFFFFFIKLLSSGIFTLSLHCSY